MWDAVKNIEHAAKFLKSQTVKPTILWEVKKIKKLIQSVIGQME